VKAGITLLGALLALALPATARAQDAYTVHYCQAPGGGVGSVDGFSAISGAAGLGFACPAGGVSSGPPTSQFGTLEAFGIRYRVPGDTRLASFVLWRTVAVPPPWNYTLFADSDAPTVENSVETCWTVGGGPCRGVGDGRISNASRIARTTPDTGGLLLWVDCNPGPCTAGGSTRATVHRLDAELSDRFDPVLVGTPSGDLLDSQRAVAGTRSIAFSASDRGGGIYRAAIEVDGAAAVSQVVDDNGGRCREPFTAPVPCRLTASGSIALDTATLADGVHSVRLVVSDATGTNAVAYGPVEITTRNQAPGCDPAVTRATTPVTARFRGTRRTRLTRARGRGARIRGTVAGAGAGTPVFLIARAIRRGARDRVAARGLTAADGSYRLRVPRGPSRRLRVGYRVRSTDPLLACSRPLRLNTPARLTLRVRPRSVPAGGRVRLSGRLLGGKVPARGKTVELQAFERGRWRTFQTARARRGRRFVARYRFSSSAAGRTFPMRARARPDALYPFSTGHSRVVRVRVL
jgi:hypothetical protein